MAVSDWDPTAYAAFGSIRLRPALDLLANVPELPPGDVVDLGCGNGAAAAALAARFPGRRLIGIDTSSAMLAEAAGYHATVLADIADWHPLVPPALIFSNAALHWLDDHDRLLPRLASLLVPGGTLAIQMPRNFHAPSHRLLRDIADETFPGRFDHSGWRPPTHPPEVYWALLFPIGTVSVWETEYLQHLLAVDHGHPVRGFTASTAMRPYLRRLTEAEAETFAQAYDTALERAYPPLEDGSVLFPFRRLFLILTRPP